MAINPIAAYNNLIAAPGNFLKQYPVRIFGATTPSGVTNYFLLNRGPSKRPGSLLGTLSMHDTESFEIRAAGGAMAAVGAGHGGHPFLAHSIHMDLGTAAMGFYRLDGAGPNIMVTGQLSGCSFAMLSGGPGQVDVAHIKPVGAMTGQNLYANLTGAVVNAQVYGAADMSGHYDSHDRVVSIIGVRTPAGQWIIFAQKQSPGQNYDYSIKSVYRIYPNKQKL